MEPALSISHLRKVYRDGTVAVEDVSLDIAPGDFFGFLGPNGAGKSTTIHCVTGIATPTSGEIRVFGIDAVKNYREARRLIGLSPQEFNVDTFATVYADSGFRRRLFRAQCGAAQIAHGPLIEKFDLIPHRKKQFRALSGGLKRRVILARALMHDPKLLILDEPTAGVDVELRLDLWRYLQELNAEGKTILLTSHYLEEIERLCRTIAIVNHGRIIRNGTKAELVGDFGGVEEAYLRATGASARAHRGGGGMSAMAINWVGLGTIIRREMLRLMRVPIQAFVAPWISALLFIFIFGYVVGGRISLIAGHKYLEFVLPGIVMLNVVNAAFLQSSSQVYFARFMRYVEETLVSPLSYAEMIFGVIAVVIIRSLVTAIGILVIAFLFGAAGIHGIFEFTFWISDRRHRLRAVGADRRPLGREFRAADDAQHLLHHAAQLRRRHLQYGRHAAPLAALDGLGQSLLLLRQRAQAFHDRLHRGPRRASAPPSRSRSPPCFRWWCGGFTRSVTVSGNSNARRSRAVANRNASVAVIGAGDFIGAAIAKRFAAGGYQVFAGRRTADKLALLKAEIEAEGGRCQVRGLDARKEADITAFLAEANAAAPLEVCIFNVGGNVNFPLLDTTERVFRKVWEMGCYAGFLAGREAARLMLPHGQAAPFCSPAPPPACAAAPAMPPLPRRSSACAPSPNPWPASLARKTSMSPILSSIPASTPPSCANASRRAAARRRWRI